MGCIVSEVESPQRKLVYQVSDKQKQKGSLTGSLQIKCLHLIKSSQFKRDKLKSQLNKNLDLFEREIKKPVNTRKGNIEFENISECTYLNNKIHIYEVLIGYCNILYQYKSMLHNSSYFNQIKPTLLNIIYLQQLINDQELKSFCSMLKDTFPQLKKVQNISEFIIKDEIVQHHKLTSKPSAQMINKFSNEFCSSRQLDIQLLKASGIQFQYL